MNSITPVQHNFIPKTTFSYHPTSAPQSLPLFYSFEEEAELDSWTMIDCEVGTGIREYAAHSGSNGFRFYYNYNPPQYLISPKLEGTEAINVSFYYKNDNDYDPETFQVGYSTTTKSPAAFTWGAEVTADQGNAWMRYENTFPEGTKYVAVRHNSYNQMCLYIDDFSINPVFCQPEDQCMLIFELTDEYGDTWDGNAIRVKDVETGAVLATMANDRSNDEGWTDTQTKFLYACNGRRISFEWVRGVGPDECYFDITTNNGGMILEFEDCSDLNTGDVLGTYRVICGDVTQSIALASGWNWVSFNVEITLDDLKAAIKTANPGVRTIIKSKSNGQTMNTSGTSWTTQLSALDLSQMYEIKVANACTITVEGQPINPADHPATIHKGANWIAYPLNVDMLPKDAFDGFAERTDKVKSKFDGEATCINPSAGNWTGNLSSAGLKPGNGYIYTSKANGDKTFTYPTIK